MKTLLLATALASSLIGLAQARAGITCNLTDQKGNVLSYSFGRGGPGFAPEIRVMRNNVVLSDGGPVWVRSFDRVRRTLTLQQADWSIVYGADTGHDRAALFHNANEAASGVCDPDYSVDGPSPAPAPVITAQAPAPSSSAIDAVGMVSNGEKAGVKVTLGTHDEIMMIDTGADIMSISPSVAAELVNAGEAHYTGNTLKISQANNSVSDEPVLIVHNLQVGNHSRVNVPATVTPTDGLMLLPFPVLNALSPSGKFTIDNKNNLLIFG